VSQVRILPGALGIFAAQRGFPGKLPYSGAVAAKAKELNVVQRTIERGVSRYGADGEVGLLSAVAGDQIVVFGSGDHYDVLAAAA
jgi:hypothetical protein